MTFKNIQISFPYTSVRKSPINLKNEDNHIFGHELSRQINPSFFFEIKNLFYNGSGLFQINKKKRLPEQFFMYNYIQKLDFFHFISFISKQFILKKVTIIRAPVVFVVDHWSEGYFHWMVEVLPRLVSAKSIIGDTPVILPAKFKNLFFVTSSFKKIGINYFFLDEREIYFIRKLFFISHVSISGNYNDLLIRNTRQLLVGIEIPHPVKKKVYISRRFAEKRKIENEDDLIPLFISNGFEIAYAEKLSFEQQLLLFSSTDILVANHGAGLTNMIFMRPGSKVLEIRYKNDSLNNCYFSLSASLNIDYYYLNGVPVTDGENPHTANIVVDILQLQETIQDML